MLFFFGMVICQVDSHLINGIILNNEMSVERSVWNPLMHLFSCSLNRFLKLLFIVYRVIFALCFVHISTLANILFWPDIKFSQTHLYDRHSFLQSNLEFVSKSPGLEFTCWNEGANIKREQRFPLYSNWSHSYKFWISWTLISAEP